MSDSAQQWITGDGKFGDVNAMPEDIKGVVSAKKWSGISDVVKSYKELESYVGGAKNKLNIPEQLDDAAVNTIYSRLGRPEAPDKYEFKYDNAPLPLDEQLLTNFKQFAHQKNLTNAQFQEVVKFQVDAMAEAQRLANEQETKSQQEAVEALKKEWKENYDGNFKKAKETAGKLGILEDLEGLGLADNPSTIKMLMKINSQLSEDVLKPKDSTSTKITKEQELKELMASDAMKNRMHPDHKRAHARFLELHGVGQA